MSVNQDEKNEKRKFLSLQGAVIKISKHDLQYKLIQKRNLGRPRIRYTY
jgi:hypothetical protein